MALELSDNDVWGDDTGGAAPVTIPPASGAQNAPSGAQLSDQDVFGATPPAALTATDPDDFVRRIARQENRTGNEAAVSKKGARGAMQVMDATNWDPGYGVAPARDNSPAERTRVGQDYARAMLNTFGDETLAAAAYDAGPGQVNKWIQQYGDPRTGQIGMADFFNKIPAGFQETKDYVQNVAPPGGQQASVTPAPGELSDAQVWGTPGKELSDADVWGPPKQAAPSIWNTIENFLASKLQSGKGPAGGVLQQGIANVAQGETGGLTPYEQSQSTGTAMVRGYAESTAPYGELGGATVDWLQKNGLAPTQKSLTLWNALPGYLVTSLGFTGAEALNVMSGVYEGGLHGLGQALSNTLQANGMPKHSADDFARDAIGPLEIEMMRGGHPEVPRVEIPGFDRAQLKPGAQPRPEAPAQPAPRPAPPTRPVDTGLGAIGLTRPGLPAEVPKVPIETPDEARLRQAFAAQARQEEDDARNARAETEGMRRALPPSSPLSLAPKPAVTPIPPGEAIKGRPVSDDTAVTVTGRQVPVQYQVVEANDLIASHTADGTENPDYPKELQPRDRSRAASKAQIADIANTLNPRLVDRSPTAQDGAPIVAPDGVVESGNARTLGIRSAYEEGSPQAQAYRDYLAAQGYPVEGMTNPVLVRVRTNDMAPADRQAFVEEANKSGTAEFSSTERAMSDARAMPDHTLDLYQGGDVDSSANSAFVREFVARATTPAEYGKIIGKDGKLSQDGIKRVNNMLLAKAYDDPSLVEKVTESPDSDIKAIGGALQDAAPEWAKLRAKIASGEVRPDMDHTANLLAAANLVEHARKEGQKIGDFLVQNDAFGGAVDETTERWLRLMFRDTEDWKRPLGRKALADGIRTYAREAAKATNEEGLFGIEQITPGAILDHAIRTAKKISGEETAPAGLPRARKGGGATGEERPGPEVPGGSPEAGGPAAGAGLQTPPEAPNGPVIKFQVEGAPRDVPAPPVNPATGKPITHEPLAGHLKIIQQLGREGDIEGLRGASDFHTERDLPGYAAAEQSSIAAKYAQDLIDHLEGRTEPGAVDAAGKPLPQVVFPGMEKATDTEALIHRNADAQTRARLEADLAKRSEQTAATMKAQENARAIARRQTEEFVRPKTKKGQEPDMFAPPSKQKTLFQLQQAQPTTETVGVGADLKRLIDLFGPKMYGANMPQVTAKELLQNSFDAVKAAYQRGDIQSGTGHIQFTLNTNSRELSVSDNGAGMSPQTVKDAFLTIAGTNKDDLAEADRSGGFGVAKLAFIFGNKSLRLETVRDGVKTTLHTSGAELLNGKAALKTEPTTEAPHTYVTVEFPDAVKGSDGRMHPLDLPNKATGWGGFDALGRPLIGDVSVGFRTVEKDWRGQLTHKDETLPIGRNQDMHGFNKLTNVHFPWGDVGVYLRPTKDKFGGDHAVLSSGIYQFNTSVSKPEEMYERLPYDLIFDVRPKVEASDSSYPFNNQREDFSPKIKEDITQLKGLLMMKYADEKARDVGSRWASVEKLPMASEGDDPTGNFQSAGLSLERPKGNPLDIPPDVRVENGKIYIGGNEIDSEASAKEQIKTSAENYKFPPDVVPTDRPLYHNNLNVDPIAEAEKRYGVPQFATRSYLSEMGSVVQSFRSKIAAIPGYEEWNRPGHPVGLSFDKGYHGVHLNVPFKGFFLNPASVELKSPNAIANAMYLTLVHEAAHTRRSGHDESFTVELHRIHGLLEDKFANLQAETAKSIADTITNHQHAFEALRSVLHDDSTENVETTKGAGSRRSGEPEREASGLLGRPFDGREEQQLANVIRQTNRESAKPGEQRGNVSRPSKAQRAVGASGIDIGQGVRVEPVGQPSVRERAVIDRVSKIADQLIPKAEVVPARAITAETGGRSVGGRTGDQIMGVSATGGPRELIAWSLRAPDVVGTLRHEAIHWLRQKEFFRPREWDTLVNAARNGDWLRKHDILARYPTLDADGQIEEAIADQFGQWQRSPKTTPTMVRPLFDRLAKLLGRVGSFLRKSFGEDVSHEDVFNRIESGEIGARAKFGEKPEVPEKTGFGRRSFQTENPADSARGLVKAINMALMPMAEGSKVTRAVVKDWLNRIRLADWHGIRMDKLLKDNFTVRQQEKMWNAGDEESVLRQTGQPTQGRGLDTLTPAERSATESMQQDAQNTWDAARAVGMVEGEGLPSYMPRMFVKVSEGGAEPLRSNEVRSIPGYGREVQTTTPQLKRRKYLTTEESEAAASAKFDTEARVVRNIRVLPMATARLRKAVAGRALINAIKEIGRQTGEETVREGAAPGTGEHKWFTIDGNPSFTTWRPKFVKDPDTGRWSAMKDQDGNTVFERIPIYVRDDFEGPLRAGLTEPEGAIYRGFMNLKSKAMNNIMFSPLVQLHLMTELGRAFPAAPLKTMTLRIITRGRTAKNDPEIMTRAILGGMVPVGRHFERQDISGMMEHEQIAPGRSLTAKTLGYIPGLLNPRAGEAVYRAIDAAGNFMHNTMLWDQVGSLQAGLFDEFSSELVRAGYDQQTADRLAAHEANRFAGTLPKESMSQLARKLANVALFSRTYTLGNLGVVKDMITGLPRDVQAQIERDAGTEVLQRVKSLARRRAIARMALDVAVIYASTSLVNNAFQYFSGRQTGQQILQGYVDRWKNLGATIEKYPMMLLDPFLAPDTLSSTASNETDPQTGRPLRRVLIGYDKQGTAIYARNPVGKFAEEYANWIQGPIATLKSKLSPFVGPTLQVIANNDGLDKKIYQPTDSPEVAIAKIIGSYIQAMLPMDQLYSAYDVLTGQARSTDAAKLMGRTVGVTFRRGYPGGPAAGAAHEIRSAHEQAIQSALPDLHRQFDSGDRGGAIRAMVKLGMQRQEINGIVRAWAAPASRAVAPRYATPEQRSRVQQLRGGPQ